jgi:hypothetical protein
MRMLFEAAAVMVADFRVAELPRAGDFHTAVGNAVAAALRAAAENAVVVVFRAAAVSGKARRALRDPKLSRAGSNLKANGRIR